MSPESSNPRSQPSLFRNWISLSGLVLAAGSFFAFLFLFILDLMAPFANPYMGLLTYFVAPAFLIMGLCLIGLGAFLGRRAVVSNRPGLLPSLVIDLSQPRQRRLMGIFVILTVVFLLATAVGSYKSYHFTESVQFCGLTCHTVMQPEYETYLHSPHAKVECARCHVGPGVEAFVRAKLAGTHQLMGVIRGKYPTPVPAPVKGMPSSEVTCQECHWAKRFVGSLDRTYTRFLADKANTAYTIRLLLNVGGSDPTHGPVGGIHYHMNVGRTIEYIATDDQRQTIPWVRVTNEKGAVTEYRIPDFKDDPAKHAIRRMECVDCHNRVGHQFGSPGDAVDLAMSSGRIDRALPSIKKNAVAVLTKPYTSQQEAARKIAEELAAQYPNEPRIQPVIAVVQEIYSRNFFPAMKASWKAYPDNAGHKDSPGCFRCHDGQHVTADKKTMIRNNDCNACHIILTQRKGDEKGKVSADGLPFEHPGGEIDASMKCSDCHNGGPM